MSIETYLGARLMATAALTSELARWHKTQPGTSQPATADVPAIFLNIAPADTDPGWAGGTQYPRITYQVSRSLTVGQTLRGTIHFQIWTRDVNTATLRGIQNALMAEVNALPLMTDEGLVECTFQTATPFRQTNDSKVIGVDLMFDYTAFVSQTTFAPDPIAALSGFVKVNLDPNIQSIPTPNPGSDGSPLLYWRAVSDTVVSKDELWWGEWHTVVARGHVLCPGAYARLNWTMLIARALSNKKFRRLMLSDGSPLRVTSIRTDMTASPTAQGQIAVEARYGTLSSHNVVTSFTHAPFDPITGTEGSGGGSGGTVGGGPLSLPPFTGPVVVTPPPGSPEFPLVNPQDTGALLAVLNLSERSPDSLTASTSLHVQNTNPTQTVTNP